MKKLFLMIFIACYALAYEDTDNSNVSVEVGIGYLNTTFTGKQSGYYNRTSKGNARGVDMYAAVNVYATERLGISFGMGAEFLNGDWNDECSNGVGAYNYSYAMQVLNFYLAQETSSPVYSEQLEAIKKVAGDSYDSAFDASKPFNPNQTGSQGYLDKIETTQYVYKQKTNGEYIERTDNDGSITGTAGKKYYELAKEGETGTHSLELEKAYLYRYNGAILNNARLYCGTPKLDVKAWYMFLGAFYDVVSFDYFALRVFGNVGVGYDMMKDKFNRATSFYEADTYQMFSTYNSNQTPSQEQGSVFIPLTAGVRFIIAKNHGIELVGKYNLLKSKWKGTQSLYAGEFDGKNFPQAIWIDTKITRDYSWGIRYVYEFRND